jgi:cytochrome c biogenesis protein CcdA
MDNFLIGFITALWLGILTSISPCPLATNMAAVTFLTKRINNVKIVFVSGLAYTVGRMLSYIALSLIITSSLLSVPTVANFLQRYMNKAIGPVLIITGLMLLDIIKLKIPRLTVSKNLQGKLAESGMGGAFVLGLIFALVFCPVSAAIFFGSLIPLVVKSSSGASLALIYGIGTGLPVLVFAVAIALGVTSLSRWLNRITRIEYYTRKITGIVFILVGLYYTGIYILRLF